MFFSYTPDLKKETDELEKLQNFLKDLRANIEDFFGDILDPDNLKEVKNWLKDNEITNNIDAIPVSCESGRGVDELKKKIISCLKL